MLPRCTSLFLGVLALSSAQWNRTSFIQQPLPNSGIKERFGLVSLSRSGLCGFISAPSCGGGTGCQPGTVYAVNRTVLGEPFSPRNGTALLTPAAAMGFGAAHAISATCSLAIVGAGQTSFSSGRAYIYLPCVTQPSGWCLSATLAVSDLGLPTFGSAVATNAEGWGVAVGARNSGSPNGKGSVWFCTPLGLVVNASTWSCEKLLPTGASGDWMGSSVAISDDALTLVATLPYSMGQGAVNVWTRPAGSRAVGSGLWSVLTQLNPNSGGCNLGTSSNRNYGVSLAMSGDASVIVVGAAQGGALYGAAVVFDRQPGGATRAQPCCAPAVVLGSRGMPLAAVWPSPLMATPSWWGPPCASPLFSSERALVPPLWSSSRPLSGRPIRRPSMRASLRAWH